ncbi:MAG: cell division protein ZapD [Gammaproteobacteria bacterium]|nr:cell division protein ZapD [Gammaproteobacteria bacterium]
MRTYIRLEHLFKQALYTLRGYSVWDSRATFTTLVDIIDILTRSDFKADMLKELERQQNALAPLMTRQGVDHEHLSQVLNELRKTQESLHGVSSPLGQGIREDDLFSTLRQRHTVAGGDCAMDLPAYHLWLQQSPEQRIDALELWLKSLEIVNQPITLMLSIVRASADLRTQLAPQGFYQQTVDTAIPLQIIRVSITKSSSYFAEISAGKHRFTVRFMKPHPGRRPVQVEDTVEFQLGCCAL